MDFFRGAAIPIWTPIVDDFLKSQNLVLRETLLDIPPPAVEPPANLTRGARDEFKVIYWSEPHKAFAVSRNRAFRIQRRSAHR